MKTNSINYFAATSLFAALSQFVTPIEARADTVELSVNVDATELHRKLLHSKVTFVAPTDNPALLFPKWIPGTHGPRGPIENLGGFSLSDRRGDKIAWERDSEEVFRFKTRGVKKGDPLTVELDYILNQPTVNSRGVDSYGTSAIGVINWNTVLVYPEGVPAQDIIVSGRIVLPYGWKHGSALVTKSSRGNTLEFEPVNLVEFIDRPLICGKNFKSVTLAITENATYYMDIAADEPRFIPAIPEADSIFEPFRKMVFEAEALFGGAHFSEYHLLLILSDNIPSLGLEHRNSSLNGVPTDQLKDADWSDGRISYLIPHEFAHAWCGKYRRPAGMNTPDFQKNKNTELLWVYEGMTQYLGYVLEARAGFRSNEALTERFADLIGRLLRQKGRQWRSLRDTEVTAYTLRGGSKSWTYHRRNQDYYREGAGIWLEIDSRIRNLTDGEKSLNDFCAQFFSAGDKSLSAVSFDLAEIVTTLNDQAPFAWDSLITLRVFSTHKEFDIEGVSQAGYTLELSPHLPEYVKEANKRLKRLQLYESLGLSVKKSGEIQDIIPGSRADLAKLIPGTEIVGVNGKKFSLKRLEEATRASDSIGKVDLLVLEYDYFRNVTIKYDGGLKFYQLVRDESKPDRLAEIFSALATDSLR
ncbi:MAG: hypothetical protein IIB00_04530 [candidate division Zixibacteria bacterium]|nr:hypothetical protein [candidate division Zixibacteria bacterium]